MTDAYSILKEICENNDLELIYNGLLKNGDIIYKHNLKAVLVGETVAEENFMALKSHLQSLKSKKIS